MEQQINHIGKNNKGFTLVELLIVVVILGIVATVTVFAVKGMTDKAKTNTCAADRKAVEVAVETYHANTGAYALTEADLVPSFLRAPSPNYTTDSTGAVAAISGNANGCT